MKNYSRVQVLNSVEIPMKNGFRLALEWCRYVKEDRDDLYAYRFIWKDEKGRRIAHRGQAAILSKKVNDNLWGLAVAAGWGNHGI